MRTLALVRHAKSSWSDSGLPDHDRPLNKRGRRDAPEMGRRLKARGFKPEVIVTSTARRAVLTAEAIAESVGYPVEKIIREDSLYAAGPSDWFAVIRKLDNRIERAVLIGHNPAVTSVANRLLSSTIDNLPTCAVVMLEYDAPAWRDVMSSRPVEEDVDFPKKRKKAVFRRPLQT